MEMEVKIRLPVREVKAMEMKCLMTAAALHIAHLLSQECRCLAPGGSLGDTANHTANHALSVAILGAKVN